MGERERVEGKSKSCSFLPHPPCKRKRHAFALYVCSSTLTRVWQGKSFPTFSLTRVKPHIHESGVGSGGGHWGGIVLPSSLVLPWGSEGLFVVEHQGGRAALQSGDSGLDVVEGGGHTLITAQHLLERRGRGVVDELPPALRLQEVGALRGVLVRATVHPQPLEPLRDPDPVVLGDLHHSTRVLSDPAQVRAEEVPKALHSGEPLGRSLAAHVVLVLPVVPNDGVVLRGEHQGRLQPRARLGGVPGHGDQHVRHVAHVLQGHPPRGVAGNAHFAEVHVALQSVEPRRGAVLEGGEDAPSVPGLIGARGELDVHDVEQVVQLDAGVVRRDDDEPAGGPVSLLVHRGGPEGGGAVDHDQNGELPVRDGEVAEAVAQLCRLILSVRQLLRLRRGGVLADVVGDLRLSLVTPHLGRVPRLNSNNPVLT
eukprot:Hpha_TRINITY_DN15677_c5_g2::TRINITY_DN15677_c5_g2_i2::g.100032::m.100032